MRVQHALVALLLTALFGAATPASALADSVEITGLTPQSTNPYGWVTVWTVGLSGSMSTPPGCQGDRGCILSSGPLAYAFAVPGDQPCSRSAAPSDSQSPAILHLPPGSGDFPIVFAAAEGTNRICADIESSSGSVIAVTPGIVVTNGVPYLKSPSSFRCANFSSAIAAQTYFKFYGQKPFDWEAHGNRCEFADGPWAAADPQTPYAGWRQFLPKPAELPPTTPASSTPDPVTTAAPTALRAALLERFGSSLRRGSGYHASCAAAQVGVACKFGWKYRGASYRGTATVASVRRRLKVSWKLTRRASGKCRPRCVRAFHGSRTT